MATPPPPAPGSTQPPKKKSNVLLWVIVGVFAFFLLIGMVIVGGMYFVWNKAQDAISGMEGNPALAVTKLITTMNPDLEVISVDETNNKIKIRQKSSNKTIELDLDRIKEGNLSAVFEGEEGPETFEFNADEAGSVEMKSGERTVNIGAPPSKPIPVWASGPPDVAIKSIMSNESSAGFMGVFTYKSKEPAEDVMGFHKKKATEAGLEIKNQGFQPRMARLEAKGKGRSLQVFFTTPADGPKVEGTATVTYREENQ